MSWIQVTVDQEKVAGFEPSDFIDPITEEIDTEPFSESAISASREIVRDMLTEHLGQLAISIGEEAMFSAISETPAIQPRLSSAMTYAFLHQFYRGSIIQDGDAKTERSDYYYGRLVMTIKALAEMSRQALSDLDNPVDLGKSGSVQIPTSTNWWDA